MVNRELTRAGLGPLGEVWIIGGQRAGSGGLCGWSATGATRGLGGVANKGACSSSKQQGAWPPTMVMDCSPEVARLPVLVRHLCTESLEKERPKVLLDVLKSLAQHGVWREWCPTRTGRGLMAGWPGRRQDGMGNGVVYRLDLRLVLDELALPMGSSNDAHEQGEVGVRGVLGGEGLCSVCTVCRQWRQEQLPALCACLFYG